MFRILRLIKIVNGAGLAMNTVDAIAGIAGEQMCANFLDTGGKATSETIKQSFKIILDDPRVKTIFVNIFGGLTLCDMIAKGIMLAYQDLNIAVPVVIRLRGTNEKIGQQMVFYGTCLSRILAHGQIDCGQWSSFACV